MNEPTKLAIVEPTLRDEFQVVVGEFRGPWGSLNGTQEDADAINSAVSVLLQSERAKERKRVLDLVPSLFGPHSLCASAELWAAVESCRKKERAKVWEEAAKIVEAWNKLKPHSDMIAAEIRARAREEESKLLSKPNLTDK